MNPPRTAEWRGDAACDALAAVAERVRVELGVGAAAVSLWERDEGSMHTIVNVGALGPGERARPTDEIYPVHSFPALVKLLERRAPYCFAPGDQIDVSSASLAASLGRTSQASAPITWRGEVWGSLWVSTVPGERTLSAADLPRVVRAANEIARVVDAIAGSQGAR